MTNDKKQSIITIALAEKSDGRQQTIIGGHNTNQTTGKSSQIW